MIYQRREEWGRVFVDGTRDTVWAETISTAASPRVERPISGTLALGRPPRGRGGERREGRLDERRWPQLIAALKEVGLLRINLTGFEHHPPEVLEPRIASLLEMDFSVVLTALDCDERLEPCLRLPSGFRLQVVLDGDRARRAVRTGGMPYSERLRLLNRCVRSGLRMRVLTPYDPWSRLSTGEVAEDLSRVGVEEWFLYPRSMVSDRDNRLAVEDEVSRLCEDFPDLGIDYGDYLERELHLRVGLDGSVKVRGAGREGKPLHGTLKHLLKRGWLPPQFLDQHVQSWLDGFSISDQSPPIKTAASPLVFLSYNHLDREAVVAVRDRLAGHGIATWLADLLQSGTDWYEALAEAFDRSAVFLFFVGPHGLGDFQRRHEITEADRRVRERGSLLIPVFLPGVRPEARLPMLLNSYQALDLRKNRELRLEELVQRILLQFSALPGGEGGRPEWSPEAD